MRLAAYNVEWFNALFDDAGRLLADAGCSGRTGVTRREQARALGVVFTALDADAVLVVEAPDTNGRRCTLRALETFAAAASLRARKAVMGFRSATKQEIALLYDPDRLSARHDPMGAPGRDALTAVPRFDGSFRLDPPVDGGPDTVTFSKPPLELDCRTAAGRALRLIGVHLKSKAPHGARAPDAAARHAIASRATQLAQALWLRRRIDEHLAAGESLVLLGDLNDVPGLDEYEQVFGRSSVEIVMGLDAANPALRLHDPHARRVLRGHPADQPATARVFVPAENRWLPALLDYAMVSPDLLAAAPRWRIWHPFDDPVCHTRPDLREALLTASDHFPVTLDLAL